MVFGTFQQQSGALQQAPSRRKGGGGSQQQLRSPVVKRPASAPVALQGWLHKQGSEGLMLWKKRWFVLSEYCLFYYKGQYNVSLPLSVLEDITPVKGFSYYILLLCIILHYNMYYFHFTLQEPC